MRYLLPLLLIFSIGFAQKTTIIKKQVDDEQKVEILKEIKDGKVVFKIIKDGKTEEFEADLDDEESIAKIQEKIDSLGIDDDVIVKICKKVKAHDCKKENCDPNTCTHKKNKYCDKKVKIIKNHKMMDKPCLSNENAGFLGVQIQDLTEQLSGYFKVKDGNGVLVTEVVEDSPADKAGLKAGDIITKVGDEGIENASDLTKTIRSYEPDTKVSVSVIRNGKKKKLEATLGEAENSFMYKFGDLGEMGDKHKMLLKMHPEGLEDFEFDGFPFDREQFKEHMDEMRKELDMLKEDLKKLKEGK